MMDRSGPSLKRTAAVNTSTFAALGAAILAVDNMLGFAGHHLLGIGAAPVIVVLVVLVAVSCIAFALRARDLARGIAAASVVGFVVTQSPAVTTSSWFPLSIAFQAVVPLGFAGCAVLTSRSSARTSTRAASIIAAGLALTWAVVAFVPLWLALFLALQIATLVAVTVIVAAPWIRRAVDLVRHLGDTATIR
ncbi:hypothetical protein ACLBWP_04760 [Microbacterium sp. M1A1_1b]